MWDECRHFETTICVLSAYPGKWFNLQMGTDIPAGILWNSKSRYLRDVESLHEKLHLDLVGRGDLS